MGDRPALKRAKGKRQKAKGEKAKGKRAQNEFALVSSLTFALLLFTFYLK
ncbi:hypothetical protein H6G51_01135 [Limnothrix sp. FACHB-708]|nr:hypothetical protein [Limnothrix sp. FACHB-708]